MEDASTRAELALRLAVEDILVAMAGGAGPDEVTASLLELASTCRVFVAADLVGCQVADAVLAEAHDAVVLRGHPAPLRLPPLPDVGDVVVAAAAGVAPGGPPPELVAVAPVCRPVRLRSGEEAMVTSVELWSDHTVVRVACSLGVQPGEDGAVDGATVSQSWVLGRVEPGTARLVVTPGSVVASDRRVPNSEMELELSGAVPVAPAAAPAPPAGAGTPAGAPGALAALAEDHLAQIRRFGHGQPVAVARGAIRAAAGALARAGIPADDVAGDLDAVLVAAGYLVPPPGPGRRPRADWEGVLAAPHGGTALRRVVPIARRVEAGHARTALLVSLEDWSGEWRLRAMGAGQRGWASSLPWRARDDRGRLHVGRWLSSERARPGGAEEGDVAFVPGLDPDCRWVTIGVGTVPTVVAVRVAL